MSRIRLPYVQTFIARGHCYYYFPKPGCARMRLPGPPGSEEFMSAYQAALADSPRVEIGASRTKPGTVDAAIAAYYKSDAFAVALAPETQRMRRNILERFRANH